MLKRLVVLTNFSMEFDRIVNRAASTAEQRAEARVNPTGSEIIESKKRCVGMRGSEERGELEKGAMEREERRDDARQIKLSGVRNKRGGNSAGEWKGKEEDTAPRRYCV
jgi:hypothetical protein